MLRSLLIVSMILMLGLFLGTSSSWACEQQDLEGTWLVVACNTNEMGDHCVEHGDLTVAAGGSITGTYVDCDGVSAQITGGQLSLSADCVIEGTIQTANGTLNVETGAIVGDRDHMRLGLVCRSRSVLIAFDMGNV